MAATHLQLVLMCKKLKEKEEKSNNVGVTMDITEVAESHFHRENLSPQFSDMFSCLPMPVIQ